MTTLVGTTAPTTAPAPRKRWIEDWRPDDPQFWA